ncbi:hypothetical protein I4U23_028110 [Adineta vaga]|nr:hypothetical protein I4U23_028110 [Adineta vaga]
MSHNPNEINSYGNGNYSDQQNFPSFQPADYSYQYQQGIHLPAQQISYYPPQDIGPLPVNYNIQMSPQYYMSLQSEVPQQQLEIQYNQYPYFSQPTPVSQSAMNIEQTTTIKQSSYLSADAPSFSPAFKTTNLNETKPAVIPAPLPSTNDSEIRPTASKIPIFKSSKSFEAASTVTTDSFKYDLDKYKYDYFISNLSGNFDPNYQKFGSPTGICALNDDRLLVANYDRDTIVLIDLNGVTYQLYRDLPAPKDVRLYSTNPSQAIVATKKEIAILDLETSKVIVRSKIRGFYPWNVQYLKEADIIAACDPSGERVVYLDKDLTEIGSWSFNEQSVTSQPYQKIYPYAAYFLSDNTSFVVTHRHDKCQLQEKDVPSGTTKRVWDGPARLQAYSIYVDDARQCLIPDKANHNLISVHECSTAKSYKFKSIYEPYSLTFLSNGTLCVTDWNKSFRTSGGVAILSETDLKSNQ